MNSASNVVHLHMGCHSPTKSVKNVVWVALCTYFLQEAGRDAYQWDQHLRELFPTRNGDDSTRSVVQVQIARWSMRGDLPLKAVLTPSFARLPVASEGSAGGELFGQKSTRDAAPEMMWRRWDRLKCDGRTRMWSLTEAPPVAGSYHLLVAKIVVSRWQSPVVPCQVLEAVGAISCTVGVASAAQRKELNTSRARSKWPELTVISCRHRSNKMEIQEASICPSRHARMVKKYHGLLRALQEHCRALLLLGSAPSGCRRHSPRQHGASAANSQWSARGGCVETSGALA